DHLSRSNLSKPSAGRHGPPPYVNKGRVIDGFVERCSTFASFLVSKEIEMSVDTGRRSALLGFGSAIFGAAVLTCVPARAEVDSGEIPQGAHALSELMERLRNAPRQRSFK